MSVIMRTTGALLLLASAILFGITLRAGEIRYLRGLRRALDLVREAKRRIELFGTPADALFDEDFTEEAREALLADLAEDAAVLREFFTTLGTGYKAETVRLCEYTLSVLGNRLSTAEKESPARLRMVTALPILLAVSLIVLIL